MGIIPLTSRLAEAAGYWVAKCTSPRVALQLPRYHLLGGHKVPGEEGAEHPPPAPSTPPIRKDLPWHKVS